MSRSRPRAELTEMGSAHMSTFTSQAFRDREPGFAAEPPAERASLFSAIDSSGPGGEFVRLVTT